MTKVDLNLDGLDKILGEIGGKGYVARVGILESKGSESHAGGDLSNAEIGLVHEFGSETNNVPPRSFLRSVIKIKEKDLLQVFKTSTMRSAVEKMDFNMVFSILGIKAEGIVKQGFSSSGFGTWPQLKPATVAAKGSSRPLIDTGQLRRSISSDVIRKGDI